MDNICISLSTGATNPQVRKRAISLIGTRQLESAKPLLHNIARTDLDDGVRQAAKDALTQIGGKVNDIVAAVMPFTVQGDDPKGLALAFNIICPVHCHLVKLQRSSNVDRWIA